MTTPQNTPPSPDEPPAGRVGLDLAAAVRQFLVEEIGVAGPVADAKAGQFVAGLGDVESFVDPVGHLWTQMPVFDDTGRALPFDRRNVAALQMTAGAILMASPEAVAVFGGVVYPSAFREARISRVMWLGRAGEVTEPGDIFNSLDVIAMLHEAMFVRLQARRQHEQKLVGDLLLQHRDLLKMNNDRLSQEIAANERSRDAGGPAAEGQAGPPGAGGGP